jgi:CelD/BcsL family acetyltransferase involved in cellulose biosynthesis
MTTTGDARAVRREGAVFARDLSWAYSLGVVECESALRALREEWDSLATRAGVTAFQHHAFVSTAAATLLDARDRLLVVTARERGALVAALPLVVRREAGLRIGRVLGTPYAQYDDAIVDPRHTQALDAILGLLIERADLDVLFFRRVRDDRPLSSTLRRIARRQAGDAAPAIELTPHRDIAGFLATRSGKKRQNIRRGRKELEAIGTVSFEVLRGAAAISGIETAITLKRRWLADTGRASAALADPRVVPFLSGLTRASQEAVAVSVLSVDGRPAAMEIGFLANRRYLAFLGAVAPEFAEAGPGTIQMAETIAWCIAQGHSTYDLLPPSDAYKTRWTDTTVPVFDYGLPLGLRGILWLDLWQAKLRPALKRAYERAPVALRRVLAPIATRS